MIKPKTEVIQLESRLGRVGSIQAYDPWDSRKSIQHAMWWVSKIARLSHGLGEAEDFEAHYDRVVNQMHHESVLEFVPFLNFDGSGMLDTREHLPAQSLRHCSTEYISTFTEMIQKESNTSPASAFLVEAPIFVARQWMRHRSFAYLEMSRRYTKGSRVPWEFYGVGEYAQNIHPGELKTDAGFWNTCDLEYQRRLDAGWPNEIARGCMPVEAMTKFWTCGFDRDWEAFLKLRDDDHAQPEIRTFASWISTYLKEKVS